MANRSETYPVQRYVREGINLKSFIAVSFLSFLIARAFILKGIAPFGISFFGASILSGYPPLPVAISIIAGRMSVEGLAFPFEYSSIIVLIFLVSRIVSRKNRLTRHSMSFITFTVSLIVSLGWLYDTTVYTAYDVFMVVFKAFSSGVLVYIFAYGMPIFTDLSRRRVLSREEIICFSVTLAVSVSGFGGLEAWGISLGTVSLAVLVIVSAYAWGAAVGSAMGTVLGVVWGLTTSVAPAVVGVYAFAGLLAGTFRELGKIGSVLGFIIGSAILNFYITPAPVVSMEELLVASISFFILPKNVLKELSDYTSADYLRSRSKAAYNQRIKELASIRLREISKVFKQLASTFSEISLKENFRDNTSINKLFDGICARACRDCPFCKKCWQKEFYATYKSVFQLISRVEEKGKVDTGDLPEYLKKKCIKPEMLIEATNYLYDLHRINYKWQVKMEECSQLVCEQLDNISRVIEGLAGEININAKFNQDLEEIIHIELDKRGINVSQVMVVEKSGGRSEIYIEKKSCYGCRECVKEIIPAISGIAGRKFEKSGYICNIRNNLCLLKLVESQKFQISTGVLTRAKSKNQVSGDNYTFMELKDSKYLMALSDGMGTGIRAAMESSVTINLLEQLLDAGFDHELAVKTINSILVLKSPEDNFSTLDITLIDLYSGDTKIVKIGAPPTFIKRGNEVRMIASSSLPVGIVKELDFHAKNFSIKKEDFVVMVTDGVLDAYKGEERGQWIADVLREVNTKNPQEIARIIVDKALDYYGGEPGDDMTVLVAKVWEKG